jgi:hypothetical protein
VGDGRKVVVRLVQERSHAQQRCLHLSVHFVTNDDGQVVLGRMGPSIKGEPNKFHHLEAIAFSTAATNPSIVRVRVVSQHEVKSISIPLKIT